MKEKVRVRGLLSVYLQWPLILSVLLIIATMVIAAVNVKAAAVLSVFTFLYFLIALWLYLYQRKAYWQGWWNFLRNMHGSRSSFYRK